MTRQLILCLLLICFFTHTSAQSNAHWTILDKDVFQKSEINKLPDDFQVLKLNIEKLKDEFEKIHTQNTNTSTHQIELPMLSGRSEIFEIKSTSVMELPLTEKFPNIKTYEGLGIDNKNNSVRCSWTTKGFHAMISELSSDNRIFIEPYSEIDSTLYLVYSKKTSHIGLHFSCLNEENTVDEHFSKEQLLLLKSSGNELRTYRLALACSGEYAIYHGGTISDVMSEMVILLNRVNGIYEREVAIRFVLVANNDQLIFLDGETDPYTSTSFTDIANQNQTTVDSILGSANYDIGHVLSTNDGGYAPGKACQNGSKAKGATGLPIPEGDPFYVDYFCHEIGHQLGAGHIFNGNSGICFWTRWSGSAYEPGSGSTIMSYAGLCSSQNLQLNSDDYFNGHSFDQIKIYTTAQQGSHCGIVTQTGNYPPTISIGNSGFFIPKNTPFILAGNATDPNGDSLTYCWEQYDLGPQGSPNQPAENAPIFRSFFPINESFRYFPQLSDIVNNQQTLGEILPSYNRSLRFRLTARDNKSGGGGVAYDTLQFYVIDSAGPFLVTSPNEETNHWMEGRIANVTWDIANTNASPVNCATVDILLSLDGGYTYPVTMMENISNTGTALFIVPRGLRTSQARVLVKSSNNVFFDISNHDFIITAPQLEVCAPEQGSISLDILSLFNFTSTADLIVQDIPNDLNVDLNTNSISVGQTLEMTFSNTENIPTGIYPIKLLANSNGLVDSLIVYLTIYAETPTTPIAVPFTNSEPVELLTWFEDAPHKYQLQVALEPTFNQVIVDTFPVLDNQFWLENIDCDLFYYWRVKAENACQSGDFSSTFTRRCFDDNSNNQNPIIIHNRLLKTYIGVPSQISNRLLKTMDGDNSSDEIKYTIVNLPKSGTLILDNQLLLEGNTFTQWDIDNNKLFYTHDMNGELSDSFHFHVDDGVGGWIGTTTFEILTEDDEKPFDLENDTYWIYPNPATSYLNILLQLGQDDDEMFLSVYNLSGQLVLPLRNISGQEGANLIELETNRLLNGVYILEIKGSNGLVITACFVVNK